MTSATAVAHPNIAFIKYWGNRDDALRLPASGSISMNLAGLETRTGVDFDDRLIADSLKLDGFEIHDHRLARVSAFLEHVRRLAGITTNARVVSANNFPSGTGVASSASAFAALALAASKAAGLDLAERGLSSLARLGSGSACRSVPGGFVEWISGKDHESSYSRSIAPPDHWDLMDCIAVVDTGHKSVGSSEGHHLASSSPLQAPRLAGASNRLDICRRAILERDFDALSKVAELDSSLMHAVMLTSSPPLLYWEPGTIQVMKAVFEWRRGGLPVFFTIDAGPNVHAICPSDYSSEVAGRLASLDCVKNVLVAAPGGTARLAED